MQLSRALSILLLGVTMHASAPLVYTNVLTDLPTTTAFFWFSLFALLACFLIPADPSAASPLVRMTLSERVRRLYPHAPWAQCARLILVDRPVPFRGQSLLAGRSFPIRLLASLDVGAYCLGFYFILAALSSGQVGVAVTVLVVQQLRPFVNTIASAYILGERMVSWPWFFAGTALGSLGVLLYRARLSELADVRVFDAVALLSLASIAADSTSQVIRATYRRDGLDALDAVRTVQFGSTIVAFVVVLCSTGTLPVPTGAQLCGLAYLGVVPTALGIVILNRSEDAKTIGVPGVEAIGALAPLIALLLGQIPLRALRTPTQSLDGWSYAGIAASIAGPVVAFALGRPAAAAEDHEESATAQRVAAGGPDIPQN